jgi:hypothetical protein
MAEAVRDPLLFENQASVDHFGFDLFEFVGIERRSLVGRDSHERSSIIKPAMDRF